MARGTLPPEWEWGTNCWGDILTEPSEKAARATAISARVQLFRRIAGGAWNLVAQ